MENQVFDLIIIGAGPGGYETAVEAAREGLNVAIVEREELGGTCLNVGCIPTKCLCHSAEVLDEARNGSRYGIQMSEVGFDLSAAVARKDEVVAKLVSGVGLRMKTPGITLLRGNAKLAGKGENEAYCVEVTTNDEVLSKFAKNIIIATGSVTKFLPIEGAHSEGVVTSTELLNMTSVPRRLCVIGGGVIGLEFASIFQSFGSEVTVVEFCKEVLPFFDRDMAKRLRTSMKKRGVTFKVGAAVTAIKDSADGKVVEFDEKGKPGSTEADLVLMAVGRGANLESLNLDEAGIAYTRRGITVDEHMRTNLAGVYAIGDINGLMQLAHAATFQGRVALQDILGKKEGKDIQLAICPAAVFTVPELAMVGKTEEQLADEGVEYVAHKAFYRACGKALAMDAEDGIVKVLTDKDEHILGAHILGAHASDLIHEVTLLMSLGGTLSDLKRTIHAHPTLSEILLAL